MAAVAVATPLRQDTEGCERGRCVCEGQGSCVPSSLVWVSVPPSGSASSNAPGSLNGLSLREGREEREREASTRRPFSNGNKEEEDARTDGDESCSSQSEDILCNSAANNVKSLVYNRNTQGERAAPHQVEGYTSRNVHNGPVLIFHFKAIKSEPN